MEHCLGCSKEIDIEALLENETLSDYQSFWLTMDHRCPDCVLKMNDYEAIWAFLETRHHYERRQLIKENFHLTSQEATLLRDLSKVEAPEVVDFIKGLVPEENIKVRDWRNKDEIVK